MFLKIKYPTFIGSRTKDAFVFIIDCYERLHKMSIVEQYGVDCYERLYKMGMVEKNSVEFVNFQLQGDTKK